jgi:hypothetical protein
MKHPLLRRVALVGVLALLSLAAAGTSLAQDGGAPTPPPPPPPPCVADAATGIACVRLVLYPATLKADLFIGEAPTEQVQQSALYVTFANPAAGQPAPCFSLRRTLEVIVGLSRLRNIGNTP